MHQHTHPYSHQHVPDDFTDYGLLIRAWQILPEIDVPRPSAVLHILPGYCWETWVFTFSGLVLGILQEFLLELD